MRTLRVVHERWTLAPLETPRVLRRCPRCDVVRRFVSSDLFRVNAHQKRVDVWLIYRCELCDFTWNHTVWTRATPDEIGRELYQRYLDNDAETAWRVAFTAPGTTSLHRVEKELLAERAPDEPRSIELANPLRVEARLDRLLASELGLSRAQLGRAVDQGTIHLSGGPGALRRAVRELEELTINPPSPPAEAASNSPIR